MVVRTWVHRRDHGLGRIDAQRQQPVLSTVRVTRPDAHGAIFRTAPRIDVNYCTQLSRACVRRSGPRGVGATRTFGLSHRFLAQALLPPSRGQPSTAKSAAASFVSACHSLSRSPTSEPLSACTQCPPRPYLPWWSVPRLALLALTSNARDAQSARPTVVSYQHCAVSDPHPLGLRAAVCTTRRVPASTTYPVPGAATDNAHGAPSSRWPSDEKRRAH